MTEMKRIVCDLMRNLNQKQNCSSVRPILNGVPDMVEIRGPVF
jgi:hypothetical protein